MRTNIFREKKLKNILMGTLSYHCALAVPNVTLAGKKNRVKR
jgi:hypothetical protein